MPTLSNSALADLEFLVRFSRSDSTRPGDRMNQRDEVIEFLNTVRRDAGGSRLGINGGPLTEQLSDDVLEQARQWVEGQLGDLVSNQRLEKGTWNALGRQKGKRAIQRIGGRGQAELTGVTKMSKLNIKMGVAPEGPQKYPVVQVSGALADVFKWRVLDVLRSASAERLRVCPECEMLFVRTRRQDRCSRKCTNDFWNRHSLQAAGAREKRRKAARANYERQFPKNVKPRSNKRPAK